MTTFSTFDDAWDQIDNSAPAMQHQFAVPQKVLSDGNPHKVFSNAPPQKVFSSGEPQDQRDFALAAMMDQSNKQAKEIARLHQMVSSLSNENQQHKQFVNSNRHKGQSMTTLELTMVVIALVFIVLVLYLISLIRSLKL